MNDVFWVVAHYNLWSKMAYKRIVCCIIHTIKMNNSIDEIHCIGVNLFIQFNNGINVAWGSL